MEESALPMNELILETNCFSDALGYVEDKKNRKVEIEENENFNDFSKKSKGSLNDDRQFKKTPFRSRWNLEEACSIPEWHPTQHKYVSNSHSSNEVYVNGNSEFCSVKQSSSSGSLSASPLPFVPRNLNIPRHHSHQPFHSSNPCPNHSPMFLETPETSEEGSSKPQHYFVNVFVNPHASFTVSVGDQVQVIQGPATVRMVSPSPPLPSSIPEQPGQLVHQIVDDNGVLTQVIISCQGNPPILNSSPQSPYAPPPFMVMHPPYHQHHLRHHHPSSANNISAPTSNVDQRAAKRKERLQMKLNQRKSLNEATQEDEVEDEICTKNKVTQNGASDLQSEGRTHTGKRETSPDSEQIQLALSKIDDPKKALKGHLLSQEHGIQVLSVESRSATVRLNWRESSDADVDIDPMKVKYRLLINKGKDDGPSFTEVYSGDAQEIVLNDLTPATTYFVKYQCWLNDDYGSLSPTVSFTTTTCEPEPPVCPKLVSRTKSTIQLKWNAAVDNGSKITNYILEYDEGRGSSKFVELYKGSQKQYKATKLQPSTGYRFRLAAMNSHGRSPFSDSICYSTNGPVPSQTDPPMMSEPTSKSLTISWIKRPSDETFTLQMEDESTGHGFLTVYNGPDLSYKVTKLRRFTEYKFRLQAKNEEGSSKWSEVVTFRTLPDKPLPPQKLQVKGKTSATGFKFSWEEPKDVGGIDVDHYIVHVDAGNGFKKHMETQERVVSLDDLTPGQLYKVKIQAVSNGGTSEFSEVLNATTQAIPPDQCKTPKLLKGKTKPTHFCVSWDPPENEGGAPVLEYVVLVTNPDGSNREAYRGHDFSCTIAGLHPGETYFIQVRAVNKAGSGPWSESLEAMTASSAPEPPGRPEVVTRAPHSALVSWNRPKCNGSDIIEFKLEWKLAQSGLNEDAEINAESPADDEESDDLDGYTPLYCGPASSHEIHKLLPASKYFFRVLAVNACGPSTPSPPTACSTPPGSPSAVPSLHVTMTTATSVKLNWKQPRDNGSMIIFYHIDLGNGRVVTVDGGLNECTVDGLMPDSSYKIRVQAVNSVGVGPYGSPVKVFTRSLPPEPPKLEVISCGPKFIKLKWGDIKGPEVLLYCLETSKDGENYHTIYQGTSRTYKAAKLNEASEYYFRIFATNEAGDGPMSSPIRVSTSKSPPPPMKVPHINEIDSTSCVVHWQPMKMAGCWDKFIYILQILDPSLSDSFQEVYRGEFCRYHLSNLIPNSEYQVRVGAVRICPGDDILGPFSPTVAFNTRLPSQMESRVQSKQHSSANSSHIPTASNVFKLGCKFAAKMFAKEGMTEMHWAILFMLAFAAAAAFLAFLAKSVIV